MLLSQKYINIIKYINKIEYNNNKKKVYLVKNMYKIINSVVQKKWSKLSYILLPI